MFTKHMRATLAAAMVVAAISLVFASSASALSATLEAPTNITSTKAELHGFAQGVGGKITYAFQYGKTTEYGSNTTIRTTDRASLNVSEPLTGLEPNTTYHYRLGILAEHNGYGEPGGGALSEDGTFTTEPLPSFRFNKVAWNNQFVYGSQSGSNVFEFTAPSTYGSIEVRCGSVDFENPVAGAGSELPLDANYSGCNVYGSTGENYGTADIEMNSCRYVSVVSPVGPPFEGTLGVSCGTKGDEIEVDLLSGACTFSIPAQTPASEISYKNEGEGTGATIAEDVSATGAEYSEEGPLCFLVEGNGEDGTFSWGTSLSAKDAETGSPLGFAVKGMAE